MKCKYCDYENPKDAIVCECCGATLATQKSIEFYKKEAKRKAKDKPRKEKRERPAKEKKEKKERGGKRITLKGVLITLCVLVLLAALAAVGVFFWRKAYYAPVFEESTSDYAISVYDPESGNVYFFMDGKLVPGGVQSESAYIQCSLFDGATVFMGTLGSGEYRNYVVASADGVKVLNIPGITDKKNSPVCAFDITDDGKYLIIRASEQTPTPPSGGYASRHKLYFYDIASGTDAALIGDAVSEGYIYPVFIGASRLAYAYKDSGGLYQVVVYDCATGERKVIYEDEESVRKLSYDKDDSLLTVLTEDKKFYVYTPGEAEATLVTDDYFYHTVSNGGRYIGYTNEKDEAGYIYSFETGEHTFIGNGFVIRSVNDDASIIYGYGNGGIESSYMDVYATSLGGEVKSLAAGATNVIFNGDKTECMFIVEDEVYLSQDGDYPVKVKGTVKQISKLTGCEESFVGGIFYVYGSESYSGSSIGYVYRLNESYELEVIAESSYSNFSIRLSEDKKTVFFYSDGMIYSCTEGKSGDAKVIGIANSGLNLTSNGRGLYSRMGSALYYSSSGRMKLISDKIYNSSNLFKDGILIMERDQKETLLSEGMQPTDEEGNPVTWKDSYTYSLYYSQNGGRKKLVMENIAKYVATGSSLYVYVLNENSVEGEDPLYDIYGGTDVDDLQLIISGVKENK